MKVRMKVLEAFSRNLDGQIVTGDPKHPDEDGRIILVSEAAAVTLETAKPQLAKRYSFKDEAREELTGEDDGEHEEDDLDDEAEPGNGTEAGADVEATSARGAGGAETAQKVREQRTDTSGTRKGSARRRAPAKGKTPKATEKGGAPTGGNDTTASTNHGSTSTSGTGETEGTNKGANAEPDADAAPTS